MKRNIYNRKQKNIATLMTVALLATGTFAWQAFSQMALNESSHKTTVLFNTGGRLHDDYNGIDKDVYVENYADIEDGNDIFARIRLDEYFEYGEGAGTTEPVDITLVRGDIPNVENPVLGNLETWDTYDWGSLPSDGEDENIRTYRDFEFGGSTVYMPTFNKNENSLESDINGTYAGLDGDRSTDYDRYADYYVYTDEEVSEPTDVSYADPDNEYGELIFQSQIHTAKRTLNADVISMDIWLGMGSPVGTYWVYDIDGWAYWAAPIAPQTATGLLIDEILITEDIEGEWYYGVNVVNQSATIDGWDDFREVMDEGDITEDALYLMEIVGGMTVVVPNYEITSVTIDAPLTTKVDTGESIILLATITTPETDPKAQTILWNIDEYADGEIVSLTDIERKALDDTFSEGIFNPVVGMENKSYQITASAKYDIYKESTIVITVHEPEPIPGYTAAQIKSLAGTNATINVDSIDFYVLEVSQKETYDSSGNSLGVVEEAAFLLTKEPWSNASYLYNSSSSTWESSTLRSTLRDLLSAKTTLSELALTVDTTVAPYSGTTIATYDRLFPLSVEEYEEQGLTGTTRGKDNGGGISGSFARWLRSPVSDNEVSVVYGTNGAIGDASTNTSYAVRPALWVSL